MGKIAFVFAGQGAQYPGMGKSLYDMCTVAKEKYDRFEEIRCDTMQQSFYGTEEVLKRTENTQPCMYACEIVTALCLREAGVVPHGCAGFSLGEVAALAVGGAYTPEVGFEIVNKRAAFMQKAAEQHDTAMAAVLRSDKKNVIDAVAKYEELYAVNFNGPSQIVVSGRKDSIEAFRKEMEEKGARVMMLAVSAAFHSPFMDEAAQAFYESLKEFDIKSPVIPVYSNKTSEIYGEDVTTLLAQQVNHPVLWEDIVNRMICDGYTDFVEIGPGKTLCGLIKKISREVRVYQADSWESVQKVKEEVCAHVNG